MLLGGQALRQPADLADLSTEQWFDRVGMPAPAREALGDWLALGIAAEPVAQESAKVFANVLGTGIRLGIRHRTPVTIGYLTVDLDTLYIQGALRVLEEHGVDVRYRAVARKIHIADGAWSPVWRWPTAPRSRRMPWCGARCPTRASADYSTISPSMPRSCRRRQTRLHPDRQHHLLPGPAAGYRVGLRRVDRRDRRYRRGLRPADHARPQHRAGLAVLA